MGPQVDKELTAAPSAPPVDLFIVCDTTGSMGSYILSLKNTIRQILSVLSLLYRGRVKLHIVSYKDYCDAKHGIIMHCGQRTHSDDELKAFASKLEPIGGGDYPEAVKTALNFTLEMIDAIQLSEPASKSVVIIYTDAPPHHSATGSDYQAAERAAIELNSAYRAGHDWIQLQQTYRRSNVPVYTFHTTSGQTAKSMLFYRLLGPVVPMNTPTTTTSITKATIGLITHLMGCTFDYNSSFACAEISYKGVAVSATDFQNEDDLPIDESRMKDVTANLNLSFEFDALDYMCEDLGQLLVHFRNDAAYQDAVFATLDEIFTPQNVLAVTYNPILGKLWRLVSTRRLDPRLEGLSAKLSQCVPALVGVDKVQVQKWIEDSYNQSQFIKDTILDTATSEGPRPCLVLEAGTAAIDVEDLRSLSRAPTPGAIKSVQSILTHLVLLPDTPVGQPQENSDDGDDSPRYLPLHLSDEHLFAFLPHVVHTGMTFSKRGAAVMAMLCALSNQALLKDRAEGYLKKIQGQWIPLNDAVNIPECLSIEFIKLMHRGRQYLTTPEQEVYTQLRTIHRLRLAATVPVEATLGYTPSKLDLRRDYKATCTTCDHSVSLSLMATPTQCCFCITKGVDEAKVIHSGHVLDPSMSHLVECRTCNALYAVVQTELLNVAPKCYFCRTKVPDPPATVECTSCWNQFIDSAGLVAKMRDVAAPSGWLCAVCTHTPEVSKSTRAMDFAQFLKDNPAWTSRFGLLGHTKAYADTVLNRHLNYFKLFTQHQEAIFPDSPLPAQDQSNDVRLFGKRVHDVATLSAKLVDQVLAGSLSDVCNLCFDEVQLLGLESACGRCTTKVCAPCLSTWYGETQPGRMVLQTHLKCAFCRQDPKVRVLQKFNRQACALVRAAVPTMRSDMYYGWCVGCYGVKEMVARECATDAPRDVTGFRCLECKDKTKEPHVDMMCPGCKVPTEKNGGCNHLTCVCGQHWCYACGLGFDDADATYEHLYASHEGIV